MASSSGLRFVHEMRGESSKSQSNLSVKDSSPGVFQHELVSIPGTGRSSKDDRSLRGSTGQQSWTNDDQAQGSADPENSAASSLRHNETSARGTWKEPRINLYRLMATCLASMGLGMNDAAAGALIPYIQDYYHIDYAIVSTLFIANAVGFISSAFFVEVTDKKLGRPRALMMSELIIMAGYAIMAPALPFPAFVIAYFIVGFGNATVLALNNVHNANLSNAWVLGIYFGFYGLGGTIAPIIATTLVTNGVRFSYYFTILLGLRAICLVLLGYTFRDFDNKSSYVDDDAPLNGAKQSTSLTTALKNPTTIVGALFIFAYQGAEVAISGWVISYLIDYRQGDPNKVGFVTAGFWGGITLGRLTMSGLAARVGEKPFVMALTLGSIIFDLVLWLAPNVIADSVATAVLGFLLGPIFSLTTTVCARILPRSMQSTGIAFISSAGSSGGAIVPFLTGLISQAKGTWVLHPICVSAFVVMEVLWYFLTRGDKKRD